MEVAYKSIKTTHQRIFVYCSNSNNKNLWRQISLLFFFCTVKNILNIIYMDNTSSQDFFNFSKSIPQQNFWVPDKGLKTSFSSPVHCVFVRKQQRCAACVCALHSIFPVGNWVQGGWFCPAAGLGLALHSDKVQAPHQQVQPTDDITLCQKTPG